MAYYLQMNGSGDYLKLPSMTLNKIVFYGKVRRRTDANRILWDFRSGIGFSYLMQQTNGTDTSGSGTWKVDGVTKSNGTVSIPNDTLCTIEHTFTAAAADDGNIFSNSSGQSASVISGDIYDIKIYNGATLLAWYDMTLGNVQDQSGNGRHATLTGGTWVSDSTGTTHEGASSVTGVSTLSASATVIPAAITGAASLQGVATISATADVISPSLTGSASLTGVGSVTATASVIRSASASLQGVSTLTANAAGLSVLGGAFLTGVGWVMASAIEGTELVSVIYLMGKRDLDIQLMGKRDLDVQLSAKQELTVTLYGSR